MGGQTEGKYDSEKIQEEGSVKKEEGSVKKEV
jgi:hypothetical protein